METKKGKVQEWQIVSRGLFVFALVVGVVGYFVAGDKTAIAGAFLLMTIVAALALWKAKKAETP